MNLKDILAISGYSGLFKLVSQAKNGIIVESLVDGKRFPAFSSHKVNALEDVAVFTRDGEVPLKEILKKIFEKEQGGPAINQKTSTIEDMKSYFLEILPEYDQERVYASDIKKILMWYNTLQQVNMLDFKEEENPGTEEIGDEEKENKSENEEATVETKSSSKKKDSGSIKKKTDAK